MIKIRSINRDHHGKIINIDLSDGRKVNPNEIFEEAEQCKIAGAYVSTEENGDKRLHLLGDDATGSKLDSLSLF